MTNWIAYWQQHALPILQESKLQLQQMLRRPDSLRPSDIESLVWNDPLLTAQVLRFISQRKRNAMAADVVAVEHIVMMMGVAPFLERCSHLPTIEQYLLPADSEAYRRLLQLLARARFARLLARDLSAARNDAYPEEVQAAALLHVVPEMLAIIGPKLPEKSPEMGDSSIGDLLAAWQIPAVLAELLGTSDVASVRVALESSIFGLTKALEQGWWQDPVITNLTTIAAALGLTAEAVWQKTTRQMLQLARRDWPYLQWQLPVTWLPMLPGDWPLPVKQPESGANQQASVRHDPLAERMQALHLAGKQGAPTNQIMGLTIRALSEGLGMHRIAFTLVQPAEQVLRTRYAYGTETAEGLRSMSISLDHPSLFTQLLQKPQSVWLTDESRARFAGHLPATFVSCSSVDCFLMSIFVGSKPLGLIYADMHGASALTNDQYSHFKQICMLTSRALTHYSQR